MIQGMCSPKPCRPSRVGCSFDGSLKIERIIVIVIVNTGFAVHVPFFFLAFNYADTGTTSSPG